LKFRFEKYLISTLILFVCASGTVAHHAASAFDHNASTQRTGTVTQFIYRNPHLIINMDVDIDNGDTELWKIEGQNIATLRANGFNRDSVEVGDKISVKMHPLKSGNPGGLLQGLIGANGASYSMDGSGTGGLEQQEPARQAAPGLIAYVAPPAGETLQMREEKTRPAQLPIISEGLTAGDNSSTGITAGALDPENLARQRPTAPFDLTGVWQYRGEDGFRANYGSYEFKPMPELTPDAKEYYALYQATAESGERFDDPARECYPTGMPRIMTRYGALSMMQYPTAIFMLSRLSNEYRVVYLDGRDPVPDSDLDRNWGGESLGRWEGKTLIIETTGFTGEKRTIQAGVRSSEQLKIIERYTVINDGNTLAMEFTMTDPETWIGEWKHTKFRDRILRSDVKEANCIPADNLALPGA